MSEKRARKSTHGKIFFQNPHERVIADEQKNVAINYERSE